MGCCMSKIVFSSVPSRNLTDTPCWTTLGDGFSSNLLLLVLIIVLRTWPSESKMSTSSSVFHLQVIVMTSPVTLSVVDCKMSTTQFLPLRNASPLSLIQFWGRNWKIFDLLELVVVFFGKSP